MRRAANIDKNQLAVVAELRRAGAAVAITSGAGDGFPDLVVGVAGRNYLLEVKRDRERAKWALQPKQVKFHAAWKGQVAIVETPSQALAVCGLAMES